MMPAIKANAYGHGAALVGKALQDMGISDFCVATVQEGIELRLAGITGQILILGYTHPPNSMNWPITTSSKRSSTIPMPRVLNDYGKALPVHVGIDTGMRRLGNAAMQSKNPRHLELSPFENHRRLFPSVRVRQDNSGGARLCSCKSSGFGPWRMRSIKAAYPALKHISRAATEF
ncbi:MAG: alanine racemase [Anaeromassilibacillus sp.]